MKYIVTTAQTGALIDRDFYRNIKAFVQDIGIDKVFVFQSKGRYIDEDWICKDIQQDPMFHIIESGSFNLNENLTIYHSKIPAQSVNPFNGLSSKLKNTSYILPATKVRYQSIASPYDYPRCFISTGAITRPNYKEGTAQGMKAKEEHQLGFTYINIRDDKRFEPVPITANKNGTFNFFDKKYTKGQVLKQRIDTMVLGDWHVGDTCPVVRERTFKYIKKYNPKHIVLHDFFNGHSINHHEENNVIAKIRRSEDERASLVQELKEAYKELVVISKLAPDQKIIVVNSNHDEWLRTYIEQGNFLKTVNVIIGCQLLPRLIPRKAVALEQALSLIGEIPENVKFLQEGESFRRYGVELGIHGHKGTNGSRGTPSQFNKHNIRAILGHSHTPLLAGNSCVVGTSTLLKLDYNSGGMSSWLNAHALLYPDGNFTLITLI